MEARVLQLLRARLLALQVSEHARYERTPDPEARTVNLRRQRQRERLIAAIEHMLSLL